MPERLTIGGVKRDMLTSLLVLSFIADHVRCAILM